MHQPTWLSSITACNRSVKPSQCCALEKGHMLLVKTSSFVSYHGAGSLHRQLAEHKKVSCKSVRPDWVHVALPRALCLPAGARSLACPSRRSTTKLSARSLPGPSTWPMKTLSSEKVAFPGNPTSFGLFWYLLDGFMCCSYHFAVVTHLGEYLLHIFHAFFFFV